MLKRLARRYPDETIRERVLAQKKDLFDAVKLVIQDGVARGFRRSDEFTGHIKMLFAEEKGAISFSTVHQAKGCEAERVFILYPERMIASYAHVEKALRGEECIQFVALTRARRELFFVEDSERDTEGWFSNFVGFLGQKMKLRKDKTKVDDYLQEVQERWRSISEPNSGVSIAFSGTVEFVHSYFAEKDVPLERLRHCALIPAKCQHCRGIMVHIYTGRPQRLPCDGALGALLIRRGETVEHVCPHCGVLHAHDEVARLLKKPELMVMRGAWLLPPTG